VSLPVAKAVATMSTKNRGRRRFPDSGEELPEVWGSPPSDDVMRVFSSAGRIPLAPQFDLEWRGGPGQARRHQRLPQSTQAWHSGRVKVGRDEASPQGKAAALVGWFEGAPVNPHVVRTMRTPAISA
jgi:hypothetical protein